MKGTKQSYDSKAKYFFPSIDAHMDAVRMIDNKFLSAVTSGVFCQRLTVKILITF